jgi:hypothetical protein
MRETTRGSRWSTRGGAFWADTTDIDKWWKTCIAIRIESHDGAYVGTSNRVDTFSIELSQMRVILTTVPDILKDE